MFTREQFNELTFEEKLKVMDFKAKFHKKKSKAMADMERIPKNGYNEHHKYHYARESDVKDKIRPILHENGLSFTIDLLEHKQGEKIQTRTGWMIRTDVKMLFQIIDTETGYFEEFVHDGSAFDSGDKGIYKAYSNTIKYGLMDYFLIPTGDDVEKDSPEISSLQNDAGNVRKGVMTRQKNSEGQSQGKQNKKPQEGEETPIWKRILEAEEELEKVAGTTKQEIRFKLKETFPALPMYKQLDDKKAKEVLDKLEAWIDLYKHPQG